MADDLLWATAQGSVAHGVHRRITDVLREWGRRLAVRAAHHEARGHGCRVGDEGVR